MGAPSGKDGGVKIRLLGLLPLLLSGAAFGNPLVQARYGGLRGDPVYTGPFALYWNPAAVASPGLELGVSGQVVWREASFERDAAQNGVTADEAAANAGRAGTGQVSLIPSLGASLGVRRGDLDLGVAGGLLVVHAGAVDWDKNHAAPSRYPGAVDGPQRWSTIGSRFLMLEPTLGLALKHRPSGLALGVAPAFGVARVKTLRARNLDRTDDLVDSLGNLKEGRTLFEGGGTAFLMALGVRWSPDERNTVGVTWHVGTELELEGDADVAFGQQAPSREPAVINQPLADTVRAGASLALGARAALRPSIEWARWSGFERQIVRAQDDGAELVAIERRFGDSVAGRLRADIWPSSALRLMLGAGYLRGPTPTRTHEPGLAEGDSVELGAGLHADLTPQVRLAASLFFHRFFDREITDSIQEPTQNGRYADRRLYFCLDLEILAWR